MVQTVLIPQDVSSAGKQYLRDRGYDIRMGTGTGAGVLKKEIADCEAVLVRTAAYPREVLEAGVRLKVVSRHGVGVDNVDVEAATELGIYVTNAPESNAATVAEHTIALILSLAKNIVRTDRELRGGNFAVRNQVTGIDLEGKTLGIVGLGRIGSILARKAVHGFAMKVIGYDPYLPKERHLAEVEMTDDWERVFSECDFVSLHLPATKDTRGIVGSRELHLMKPSAFLINAARGEIVNESDLTAALQGGIIAGAGLDVFESEPPNSGNPLFALDNVVVTPHSAALTLECLGRMALHAAIGIDEVLSGKVPRWAVNKPVPRR